LHLAHRVFCILPVVFVALGKDDVGAGALTEYARERLARYKIPKRFEFCELPKTSTGKIQKNVLRDRAHELKESPEAEAALAAVSPAVPPR